MTGPLVLDQLRHLIAHARDQHMHEIADYLTEVMQRAEGRIEWKVCGNAIVGLFGKTFACARPHGHDGDHSNDAEPEGMSMTWGLRAEGRIGQGEGR